MKNYGIEIEIIDKSGKNINGKEIKVREHIRSNRKDSKGVAKKK